jgi:ribonucleoside-diphosphate reductase beta chain
VSELLLNLSNTSWKDGNYPFILGQRLGLHDSMNVGHPKVFELYKRQKEIDWDETEVSLSESRMDMERAPKSIVDLMVKNLSYQWEFDSAASRSFASLLAPFITNSEFWAAQAKNQEIEVLHALTYSEIVRQCIPDTNLIFKSIVENEKITGRSKVVFNILEDLARAGAEYTLGLVKNDQALFNRVFLGIFTMYLSERLQFMSSFATTFITAEQGYFVGICKLVQKIAVDELTCHATVLDYVLRKMILTDPRAQIAVSDCWVQLNQIFNAVKATEYDWSKYIFTEGRKAVGLTTDLLVDWVDYNSYFAGSTIGIVTPQKSLISPLPYMKNWLDIDSIQNANQEGDNTNYVKIHTLDDLSDDEIWD